MRGCFDDRSDKKGEIVEQIERIEQLCLTPRCRFYRWARASKTILNDEHLLHSKWNSMINNCIWLSDDFNSIHYSDFDTIDNISSRYYVWFKLNTFFTEVRENLL